MPDILKKAIDWIKKFDAKHSNYEKNGVRPSRDWFVILVSTFVSIFLVAGVAYCLYAQIRQGNIFSSAISPGQSKVMTINKTLLDKTLNDINSRAENLAEFKQNGPIPADPSL